MDPLTWGLIAMGVSWLPMGYLASRLFNAIGWKDEHPGITGFQWKRPIKKDADRAWFALGTLFGWFSACFVLFGVGFCVFCEICATGIPGILVKTGRAIAPGESTKALNESTKELPS